MRILLIGLGRFGREILQRLYEVGYSLYILEGRVSEVEKFLEENRDLNVNVCVGDATSLIFWENFPINDFDLIVSAVENETVNQTICEIVREILKNWEIPLIVFSKTKRYEEFYANYNCKVIYLPELIANTIEALTFKNIVKPLNIGLGKNEVLEVTLSPKSPYVEITINQQRLKHWKIALIYRGDRILLPRKKVVLHTGDRVILVGDEPKIVLEVAKAMALGVPQFPLSFGENLLTVLRKKDIHYLKEYYYLYKHTKVRNLVIFTDTLNREDIYALTKDSSFADKVLLERNSDYEVIFKKNVQMDYSAGILSAPYRREFLFFHNLNLKKFFKQNLPFLIPRLSFPYRKIVVSLNNELPYAMVEHVFELFQMFKSEVLEFVYVKLPEVLIPKWESKRYKQTENVINNYINLFKLKDKVKIHVFEGNPVKKTLNFLKAEKADLLIVGFNPQNFEIFSSPYLLTKKAPISVLGIPVEKSE
jgi:hypothetical protein